MLISALKLIVPIGIMLLCNTVAPLTANALLLSDGDNDGDGDGMFLPVPRQFFPTSYDSMNASTSSPNRVQFLPSSDSAHNGSDNYYYNNFGSWANRRPYSLW